MLVLHLLQLRLALLLHLLLTLLLLQLRLALLLLTLLLLRRRPPHLLHTLLVLHLALLLLRLLQLRLALLLLLHLLQLRLALLRLRLLQLRLALLLLHLLLTLLLLQPRLALLLHLLLFDLSFAGLDALDASCADIAELLLKICVLERHGAAMNRVEFPVLELTTASDIDSVKSAVKRCVGLNRCVTSVSPIVVVPQRRSDKGCRAESDYGADSPPMRIPKERCICRRPIIGTVYDHRIVDRDVNVIRLNWFDDDVFGWSCIAGAWGRRDPPDSLLVARL